MDLFRRLAEVFTAADDFVCPQFGSHLRGATREPIGAVLRTVKLVLKLVDKDFADRAEEIVPSA